MAISYDLDDADDHGVKAIPPRDVKIPQVENLVIQTGFDRPEDVLINPWTAGDNPSTIFGAWGDDGARYEIFVPPEIRDQVIRMQNSMCSKFAALQEAKSAFEKLQQELAPLLNSSK